MSENPGLRNRLAEFKTLLAGAKSENAKDTYEGLIRLTETLLGVPENKLTPHRSKHHGPDDGLGVQDSGPQPSEPMRFGG